MSDELSFSQRMRSESHGTWTTILDHRFFREVAMDTIDDRIFARYLRIEYGFVDTAAIALGYAVAKGPSFDERWRLALGLYGLVTDQQQFFVDAFKTMNTRADQRTGLRPSGLALPLHAHFLKVAAEDGYEEILACVLAAEWMYATWCLKANESPSGRAYVRDWVALHAGGAFADHVAWVRSELDSRGPLLPGPRQARLGRVFEQALEAEIAFHDAAYAD